MDNKHIAHLTHRAIGSAIVIALAVVGAMAVWLSQHTVHPYCDIQNGKLVITGRALPSELDIASGMDYLSIGDSDLIRLEVRLSATNGMDALEFHAKSLDESRGYIFNPAIWRKGERSSLPKGYIENLHTGEQYAFGGDVIGGMLGNGIYGDVVTTDTDCKVYVNLPRLDNGDYFVTLFFYDFDTETRLLLNEHPHEVHFDLRFKVPDVNLSVCGAWWELKHWEDNWAPEHWGDSTVDIQLLLRAKDQPLPSIVHEEIKLEQLGSGVWTDCTDLICDVMGGGIDGSCSYVVRLLGDAVPGYYRLTLVLDDRYGSGEQYTLTLHLRFDE